MARTGIVAHMHLAVVEKENPLKISHNPYNLLHGFLLFYPETLVLLTGTPTNREPLNLRSYSLHVGAQLVGRIACVLQFEGSLFVAARKVRL
jgi:hypothetical protein